MIRRPITRVPNAHVRGIAHAHYKFRRASSVPTRVGEAGKLFEEKSKDSFEISFEAIFFSAPLLQCCCKFIIIAKTC